MKMNKRLLLISILVLLFYVIGIASAQAQSIRPGESVTGTVGAGAFLAIYQFDSNESTIASFTLDGSAAEGVSFALAVVDAQGAVLAQTSEVSESGLLELQDVRVPSAGTYFVQVVPVAGLADSAEFVLTRNADIIIAAPATAVVEEPEATADTIPDATFAPPTSSDNAVTTTPEPTASEPTDRSQVLLTENMEVILQWQSTDDLNLEIRDPLGGQLYFDSRQTETGGNFNLDANGLCEDTTEQPFESAFWQPGVVPTGSYEILVHYLRSCSDPATAVPFILSVSVNGADPQTVEGQLAPSADGVNVNTFITSFLLDDEGGATLGASGAYAGGDSLPTGFDIATAQATPLQADVPVQEVISSDNPFYVYTFGGTTGQVVNVSMTAISGSLDTLLQLLNSSGELLAWSDDLIGTTNSGFVNLELGADDTYTLIATRYGKLIGGTEGQFELILTGSAAVGGTTDNGTIATAAPVATAATLLDVTPAEPVVPTTAPQIVGAPDLSALGLPAGDIGVALIWNNATDLQLLVRDPNGDSVYDSNPQVTSGGVLNQFGRSGCDVNGTSTSYVYWPSGFGRQGTYEIEVWFQSRCADESPTQFTLVTEVQGETVILEQQAPLFGSRLLTSFTVGADGTATPGLSGFVGGAGSLRLDFVTALADAQTLSNDVPLTGVISSDNPYDLYKFSGNIGDIVTIEMNASGRLDAFVPPLDTWLYLVAPDFTEVASNDDAIPGENTNSLIGQFTLPQEGEYLIIGTRLGALFGGTGGNYLIRLRQTTPDTGAEAAPADDAGAADDAAGGGLG